MAWDITCHSCMTWYGGMWHYMLYLYDMIWWHVTLHVVSVWHDMVACDITCCICMTWYGGMWHYMLYLYDMIWWHLTLHVVSVWHDMVACDITCCICMTWYGGMWHYMLYLYDMIWWHLTLHVVSVWHDIITRAASWAPDRTKWLFSAVSGGIWTPHSPVLIKISADKRPLNQLTVKNLFLSLIIKTFCN